MNRRERARGALMGLAVGDAIGAQAEFAARGQYEIIDMVGGGPWGLEPGQWTDDTSMALCIATSLVEQHGFDAKDQINRYVRWMREGYLSSTGECFDIGGTTRRSLHRYLFSGNPYAGINDPSSAANGCIMRLAPIPIVYGSLRELPTMARDSCRITHATTVCLEATDLFAEMVSRALAGQPKAAILQAGQDWAFESEDLRDVALQSYAFKSQSQIFGTGYVVACLEAACYCFLQTDSYRDAILMAANLGDDTDTTAAVCGQLAGAFYGEGGIPDAWRATVTMSDFIRQTADDLCVLRTALATR